jgi:hypothetical protein
MIGSLDSWKIPRLVEVPILIRPKSTPKTGSKGLQVDLAEEEERKLAGRVQTVQQTTENGLTSSLL